MLASASRAYAALRGRDYVLPDDVKHLAVPALSHRVLLAPGAEIEGLNTASLVRQVIEHVSVPRLSSPRPALFSPWSPASPWRSRPR